MQSVTEAQIAFGRRLGMDLSGISTSEADAMIQDTIDREFFGEANLGAPTQKQWSSPRSFSATSGVRHGASQMRLSET